VVTPLNDAEEKEEAMKTRHIFPVLFLVGVFGVAVAGGQELAQVDERHSHQAQAGEIPNWSARPFWSPGQSDSGHPKALVTMTDISGPLPFVPITPCRIVDTRTTTMPNFPAGYGPPALTGGSPRNFTLVGQCGISNGSAAVSLNITVTNTQGPGFILIYPQGGAQPNVSTLNYVANQTVANAAVVPLGPGGVTVIAGVSGTDLIIDTNGYYGSSGTSQSTVFEWNINGGNFSIFTENLSTTCSGPCGVYAIVHTVAVGGTAVRGDALGNSGPNAGVAGFSNSSTFGAAGVLGFDRSRTGGSYDPSGVRGESVLGNGVLGISRFTGVAGSVVNNSSAELAFGLLGFNNSGTVYGVYAGGNFGGTGAKFFVEPHPTDASKVIRYVALEGPESGTYFRGRGKFQNGLATIDVPEDFGMVTDSEGLSIQVTPIGELATVAVVRIDLEGILVKASRNVEFFYTVNGVRKTHRDLKPIGPGTEFMPRSSDARMPAYLTEGQKAMLISNRTYNADGTVNMETARRLGWDRLWEQHSRPQPQPNGATSP
jgi:hypothetical protein